MMLKAMAGGGARAAHDDEPEDVALFKRLMRMHDQGDLKASSGRGNDHTDDLETRRVRRQLRDMQAGMELITDTLKKQSALLTDLAQKTKALATDSYRPGQGGIVRKTMAATGIEQFIGPFDSVDANEDGKTVKMADIDAALDKAGMTVGAKNNMSRMAKKIEALAAGIVTSD
jgi:hypothetical protein